MTILDDVGHDTTDKQSVLSKLSGGSQPYIPVRK